MSDVYPEYMNSSHDSVKRKQPNKSKPDKKFEQHFIKEDIWVTNGTSLVTKKMQIIPSGTTTHTRMQKISVYQANCQQRCQTMDVLTYFWLKHQMYSHFGKTLAVSFKAQHSFIIGPRNLTVDMYSREIRTCLQKDLCKNIHGRLIHKSQTLETVQMSIQKQCKCPSTTEWIKKLLHFYMLRYYSAKEISNY